MENARVVIIEDYPGIRTTLREYLSYKGHSVIKEAGTMEQALGVVEALAAGEIIADVVAVDGNLSGGRTDGVEGTEIVRRLREIENLGYVAICGISGMGEIEGVDENIPKVNLGKGLSQFIDELPALGERETA